MYCQMRCDGSKLRPNDGTFSNMAVQISGPGTSADRDPWYDRVKSFDPHGDLRAWQERLERLSLHHGDAWAPPVDVYETERTYVIAVEVPGLTRDRIELSVEKSRITIQGRREARPGAGAVHFHQIERGHGTFRRSFEFAASIDTGHITADLADGVLTVTVPKVPPPPARKIEVR